MDVTIQIFSGNFLEKPVSFEIVEQKLLSVLTEFPVSKVLMGWALDKSLYEKTAKLLSERNIDFYLWFPVFSETGAMKDLACLTDLQGQHLKCPINTDFSFFCPNSLNLKKILGIFNSEFASIGFNGIFLDRIRYPSFGNNYGIHGVFSCFCPECLAVYERENFNIEKLRMALSDTQLTFLGITEYRGNGKYIFKDNVLRDFFRLKADIIYKNMQQICMFFREKKYGIGFDVFAPFLSPFVGQDLARLSCLCDFIKPMMYRVTNAPAGLPYETESFFQQTGCEGLAEKLKFYRLLGIKDDFDENPFDLEFAAKELENMTKVSACHVYAGVEINRVEEIAETDTDYIEETLRAYAKTGIGGFALSWNLLDMPQENIKKAAEIIKLIC